jgi:MFS family permease
LLISDIFPRHRLAGALVVFSIGSSIGAGVSLGLGGLIFDLLSKGPVSFPVIGEVHPWQAVFLLTGAPGVILALLIFFAPEPERRTTGGASVSWSALFGFILQRRGFFARHFAGFSLMGILAYGGGGWVPVLMMRRYHFTAAEAGISYGLVTTVGTIVGMLSLGAILDRLIRRGVTDAPLRVFVWLIPFGLAATVAACFSPWPALFLGCWLITSVGICLAGPAATAIQFVTPAEMRGRTSALFILIFNLVGYGVGPSLVGWLTVHVYRDPMAVNLSIATAYANVAPLAWIMFFGGLKPMRQAMALAEAHGGGAERPAA